MYKGERNSKGQSHTNRSGGYGRQTAHTGRQHSAQGGQRRQQARQNGSSGQRKPIQSKWLKKRRRKKRLAMYKRYGWMAGLALVSLVLICLVVGGIWSLFHKETVIKGDKTAVQAMDTAKLTVERPDIDVQLLTVNRFSRPGTKLEKVNGIVVHYVGNPGTTASQNRSYFESLKDTHAASASSHFVIGTEGEIIQCIPTNEIAFCSNQRNSDTISIECCHLKKDGKFTDETYHSLVHLVAFLCCKFDLDMDQIIRHYDVTGKECPLYYVKHEDEWEDFKKDVSKYIETYGTITGNDKIDSM